MVAVRIEKHEVERLLTALLVQIGGISRETIHPRSSIDSDLQMESVAFLELQVALEDELGVELDPIRIVELNEFHAISEYIFSLTADSQ